MDTEQGVSVETRIKNELQAWLRKKATQASNYEVAMAAEEIVESMELGIYERTLLHEIIFRVASDDDTGSDFRKANAAKAVIVTYEEGDKSGVIVAHMPTLQAARDEAVDDFSRHSDRKLSNYAFIGQIAFPRMKD